MKRISFYCLLIGIILINYHQALSQNCTPDPNCTPSQFMCPSSLSSGCAGEPYSETITISLGSTISGVALVDITLNNITGFPSGLGFTCNPTNCVFLPNSSNCILISGIPASSGTFALRANLLVDLGFLQVPVDSAIGSITIQPGCGPCDTIVCDDGDACTTDSCVNGSCIFTTINCDDGDLCTIDTCNNGFCVNTIIICDDGDPCVTDSCINGICTFTQIICDDGDLCTSDTCISGPCVFTPLATAPEICIVGVDSATGKTNIVWEKPVTSAIDSYLIYRETNQANIYAVIGAQAYGEFSTFIDPQSAPEQNSNNYKLGFTDICGQTISGTIYHKTIHLSINQGVGNSWNLSWNHYEGFAFSSYNIYRGTTPTNLTLLNSISSNNDSYSDLNPPAANTIYYQIEVINPNSCNPSARMGNYSSSRSNIAIAFSVGMNEPESSSLLRMYPNPFSSSITIEIPDKADKPIEFNLFDITGKKLLTEPNISADRFILNRNNLMQGIYYVELRAVKNIYRGKIIAF